MEIKIWPRGPEDRGGYVMMPMKKNVPVGHEGWELTACPKCGSECYKSPLMDVAMEQGAILLCTECTLKKVVMG